MELPKNNTEIDAAVPDIAGRDISQPAIDAEEKSRPIDVVKCHRLQHLPFDLRRVDV